MEKKDPHLYFTFLSMVNKYRSNQYLFGMVNLE